MPKRTQVQPQVQPPELATRLANAAARAIDALARIAEDLTQVREARMAASEVLRYWSRFNEMQLASAGRPALLARPGSHATPPCAHRADQPAHAAPRADASGARPQATDRIASLLARNRPPPAQQLRSNAGATPLPNGT